MAQKRIAIDGYDGVQPDKFDWQYETTSTEDSKRTMSGKAVITPLFTVESYAVEYTGLKPAEVSYILHSIVQRPGKEYYSVYHYSPYHGQWRTGTFYTGQGSLSVRTLKQGEEDISTISFNMVGRDKLV